MMNFKYFNPIPDTCETLKQMYRKLAIKNHPDCDSGSHEAMFTINAEYTELFAKLKNIHQSVTGETYTAKTESAEMPEDFINIIDALIHFEGITIEVIGRFLWVSGNTKPFKEALKEMKFRWHSKKLSWYLAPEDYRKKNNKQYSMNDIRNMFGSQQVETEPLIKINAFA